MVFKNYDKINMKVLTNDFLFKSDNIVSKSGLLIIMIC